VEELLKTTILEGTKHPRANALASKTLQDLKLRLAIDEVFYLGTVDAEKQLSVDY